MEDRVVAMGGDMWKDEYPTNQTFPDGYDGKVDMILYSQILHDWPRDKGKFLLQKAYDALAEGGVVLINEKLLTGFPFLTSLFFNFFSFLLFCLIVSHYSSNIVSM